MVSLFLTGPVDREDDVIDTLLTAYDVRRRPEGLIARGKCPHTAAKLLEQFEGWRVAQEMPAAA